MGATGKSVDVMRTGTCQTGFGWLVTMTHLAGDVPLMTAKLSEEQGSNGAEVRVLPYTDGGHKMGPISVDYMHEPVTDNTVQVTVNNGAADCARDARNVSVCLFSYDDALTPRAVQLQSAKISTGTYAVTITGTGFTAADGLPPRVLLASLHDCDVSIQSDTHVECTATYPFLQAGTYPVEVIVPGKGATQGSVSFYYGLDIASITPASLNRNKVNTVTINGAGFSPMLRSNTVRIGGTVCEPIKVSARQLECTLGPAHSDNRRRHLLDAEGGAALDVEVSLTPSTPGGTPLSTSSSAVSSMLVNVPTILSILPSAGAVGGGYSVTISGSGFSTSIADHKVMFGSTPCVVIESSAISITCVAGAGVIGNGTVTVVVEGIGVSDSSSAPQFEYQLSVDSLTPTPAVFGFGGGNRITASGRGFLSGATGEKSVTPVIEVAGVQTFVIGVYVPVYRPEIHQLVITANFVNAVQRVSVSANYFVLGLWNRQTERLPKNVGQATLQTAIRKLIPASLPSVVVITTPQGWQVEFPSDLGSIPLLSGLTCTNLQGTCSANNINVTELVAGVAPQGSVGLLLGRYVDVFQGVAWRERLNVSIASNMQQILSDSAYFGAIRVTKARPSNQQVVWEITYLDLTSGRRDLPDIDSSSVTGGNVTMRRVQQGVPLPNGTFQMQLSGSVSEELSLDASAIQVQQAVTAAFPDVLSASVYALDDHPGHFLDRSYPRQWVVKLERHGVVGNSIERCTNPLYVDWDPLACPVVAPDLFLHHYPWYWPVSLPKPSDLGQDTKKSELQVACDAEARASQLRPVQCQALVPLESLPVCGQGSGVNPPCWTERFTMSKVRHKDGQDVVYARDDSRTPSSTIKGYRFWTRTDLKMHQEAQVLSLKHSVVSPGSGVHVKAVYVKAQQFVAS